MPFVALATTVGAVPLVFTPWTGDAFGLPKLTVAALGTIACGATLLARGSRGVRPPRVLWTAVVAFMVVVALTTLTSHARAQSLFGRYERYNGLLPLLVFVALAYVVTTLTTGRSDRSRALAGVVLASSSVAALYVLAQVVGLDPLDWREASGRVVEYQAGPLGNSNFAGAQFGVALAFVIALLRTTNKVWARLLVGAAGVVCAAGLMATRSRGGLLAAAVAVGLSAVALVVASTWPSRRKAAVMAAAGVGALALALVLMQTSVARRQSLDVRGRQWRAAVEIALDHPVVGTGPDTFQLFFPAYRDRQDGRELGLQLADKPHNVPLEHASSSGILGALTYFGVVAAAALVGAASLRGDRQDRPLALGFLAAGAGHVAQSLVSIDVPSGSTMWWVCLGALAGFAGVARDERPARPRPSVAPVVAVSVAALLLVSIAVRPWRADWAGARGDYERATSLASFEVVHRLNRGDAATAELVAATSASAADNALLEAEQAYLRVLDDQPRNVFARVGLGRLYAVAGARRDPRLFDRADAAYRHAVRLDPFDWQIHDQWALMLNRWANAANGHEGLRRRALERYETVLEIRPDHVPAWENVARIADALGEADRAANARAEISRLADS